MIQNNSLIVSLSISQWTARKHDKKITDEVREQHNASSDAGRYNKLLVSKEHLEELQKIAGKARNFHYENTLPWGDNNERLLPAANYFQYLEEINKLKSEYELACDGFFQNYDVVIDEAKVRLNGMFKPEDYPSKDSLTSKFDFKVSFMPVPETDFRLKLTDEEISKLKVSVETELNTRMKDAVANIWDRIKTQLVHMKDRLSDPKAVFRDSLFENLKELVQLLPKLNITGDESITDACTEMARLIAEPEAIRNNDSLRAIKADEVDMVLNKFGSFFN